MIHRLTIESNLRTKKIKDKVGSTIAKWRRYASGAGIGHAEQEEMNNAFRLP